MKACWSDWIEDCLVSLFLLKSKERQKHGFEFEEHIIQKYNLTKSQNYISCFDAFTKDNIPVQIKCIKYGCAIELGDYRRNKNKKEDFILIIGFWKKEKDNIVEEYSFSIRKDEYLKHFKFDFDKEVFEGLKLITNLKCDDERWKSFRTKYNKLWSKENLISIRFKRDHKTQKRIQCAISWKNFDTFKNLFGQLN